MQKLIFSTVLISAILLPGGAAFAQNLTLAPTVAIPAFTPWRAADSIDPAVAQMLTALSAPPAALTALRPAGADLEPTAVTPTKNAEKLQTSFRSRLMVRTLAFLGVPYKWGGNKAEEGFDCSGFVRHVIADVTGRILPRTAKEQSEVGQVIARHELKPGDLVFFNTMRRAFSHVGIYLGNNLFAHAPRVGKSVQVDSLNDAYWVKTYEGARRPVTM